jgi:hypothetical protein
LFFFQACQGKCVCKLLLYVVCVGTSLWNVKLFSVIFR